MHWIAVWFGQWMGALALWVGAAWLAAFAAPLQVTDRSAAPWNQAADAHATPSPQELNALTNVDLLRRYQTADTHTLGDSLFQGATMPSSAQQPNPIPAATSDRDIPAGRPATDHEQAPGPPAAAKEPADSVAPGSKFAALVAAVVMVLLLLACALIGFRLRSRKHSGFTLKSHRRHSHRFIAYDADRR